MNPIITLSPSEMECLMTAAMNHPASAGRGGVTVRLEHHQTSDRLTASLTAHGFEPTTRTLSHHHTQEATA